ncbi:MAG: ATP-dependent RNA helicase HrpA, partial [Desulfobacteraceae bacterium]
MLKKIESLLPKALIADRYKIGRELDRIKAWKTKTPPNEKINKRLILLEKKLQRSIKKRSWRNINRPKPIYNDALPILSKKDDIIDAISNHPVVIISGETGSGKTTQIPKFCLAAGCGVDGKIGCTQPRRIAAMTVSKRIAEELGETLGESVGYKIRFKDKTSPNAFIKIMTDGMLLAETQNDPYLNEYDTIIVDEAHERSLNIDFILGILKTLLKKRKDLKVVITSATIDTEKFSKAFNHAPVIEVSGRMYPVEVRYLPMDSKFGDDDEQTHVDMAVYAVDRLFKETVSGGMLVFMPTEQDIRETCDLIREKNNKNATVLPLFARLSASEQSRVFSRGSGRKVIVATNIAETSITIPGIKYV